MFQNYSTFVCLLLVILAVPFNGFGAPFTARQLDDRLSDPEKAFRAKTSFIIQVGTWERDGSYPSPSQRGDYIAVLFKHLDSPSIDVASQCRSVLSQSLTATPLSFRSDKYPQPQHIRPFFRENPSFELPDNHLAYLPHALYLLFATDAAQIIRSLIDHDDQENIIPAHVRSAAVRAFVVYQALHPEESEHLISLIHDPSAEVRAIAVAGYRQGSVAWPPETLERVIEQTMALSERAARHDRPSALHALGNAAWRPYGETPTKIAQDPVYRRIVDHLHVRMEDDGTNAVEREAIAVALRLAQVPEDETGELLARHLEVANAKQDISLQKAIVNSLFRRPTLSALAKKTLVQLISPHTEFWLAVEVIRLLEKFPQPTSALLFLEGAKKFQEMAEYADENFVVCRARLFETLIRIRDAEPDDNFSNGYSSQTTFRVLTGMLKGRDEEQTRIGLIGLSFMTHLKPGAIAALSVHKSMTPTKNRALSSVAVRAEAELGYRRIMRAVQAKYADAECPPQVLEAGLGATTVTPE